MYFFNHDKNRSKIINNSAVIDIWTLSPPNVLGFQHIVIINFNIFTFVHKINCKYKRKVLLVSQKNIQTMKMYKKVSKS